MTPRPVTVAPDDQLTVTFTDAHMYPAVTYFGALLEHAPSLPMSEEHAPLLHVDGAVQTVQVLPHALLSLDVSTHDPPQQ
jgi:hypothetical protein